MTPREQKARDIADKIAQNSHWTPGTDNYARIFQAACAGALEALPEDYHDLAMRTAAGPEVFHYPEDGSGNDYPTISVSGMTMTRHDIDERLMIDLRDYLIAAARLDNWKSVLFYGKSKYHIADVPVGSEPPVPWLPSYDHLLEYNYSLAHILNPQLVHAILGLASEAGEMVESLAEVMTGETWQLAVDDHGTQMAKPVLNMVRESGDIDWYQELLALAYGVPVEQSRRENIERLRKRFPNKFSEADAIARADEA